MGDILDKVNLACLVGILLINLLVVSWLYREESVSSEEQSGIRISHILWTANWLFWLLAWLALLNKLPELSVVLNDLGAFFLIAFAIVFSAGIAEVKKYVVPLVSLFVLDSIYLLLINVLVHHHTFDETRIPQGAQVNEWLSELPNLIQRHTVLFGPSLCLTMLAIGVVAWSLAHRSKHFLLCVAVGLVGIVYSLAQLYVYQNGLLVPFLQMTAEAKGFLIFWRIVFVSLYYIVVLATAGITVPGAARVAGAIATAIGVISSIVSLVSNLLGKH
jgi:hypothetical protein